MSAMRRALYLGLVLAAAAFLPQATAGTGGKNRAPSGVILFSSNRDGDAGLNVVNADGNGLKKLTLSEPLADLGPSCVSWSHDGAKIAFQSRDSSLVVVAQGGRSRLLSGPIGCGFSWSPDNRTIAYTTFRAGTTALELVDVVTRKRRVLTKPPPESSDSSVEWSPDGRRLAFLRYERNGPCVCSGLYVVRRDGSGLRLLSGGQDSSVFFPPTWSPGGGRLAFLARDGLFAINANGTGKRRLSRGSFVPVWSPRGDEIALTGYAAGGRPGVFLVRPNGSGLRQLLSFSSGSQPTVVWAPDGRHLAVQAGYDLFHFPDIDVVDVASGHSRTITQSRRFGYIINLAQWHPRAPSTRRLRGTPVSWAIPSDSIAATNVLQTREPVEQLVADGTEVAIASSGPRCLLELWQPPEKRPVRFASAPSCQPGGLPVRADLHPFNDLALGGDRVAFPVFSHQAGTNARAIVTGTRERPAREYITGLCPEDAPYYCIRPPIGDLKAQGSLFVFDSWEGPDFYCATPCPPPKRNGGLWRLDRTQAVQIASSSGPLTPLSVDAGRILVDHEDGTMDIRTANGSVLRSFTFNAALVRSARLQGDNLVVLTPSALEITDAGTGQFLRRWPLPAPDAVLADLQDGIGVLVAGTDIHLLRLSDGRDAVIHVPGSGSILAQLEPSGLFYSYTVPDQARPGRVAFVPFDRLPLR